MKAMTCLLVACAAACAGCQGMNAGSLTALKMPDWNLPTFDWKAMQFRSQSPLDDEDEFETKVKTELIGRYTTVSGLNMITLEGVGLVVGLNGTGGDPPPSMYRTVLLNEMRKRKVKNPNRILRDPNTALVVVRAYLPPLIRKGEHFDVEVRLVGNSRATSLDGGWLLGTYLSERAIVPGRGVMKGHVFAKASGPILISATDGDRDSLAGVLRRGQVLAGGVSMKERNLFLDLRSDFRGVRNAGRIATRIGKRFFSYNRSGLNKPLAEAKTDQRIELKVQPRYRDNYPRYLQVIRHINFKENNIQRRLRIQKLRTQLLKPEKAETAALQLEAIGQDAIPALKNGLKRGDPEVRFHSAVALAYLDQPDGLKVLAEAARTEPAFRIFALAAMATVDDGDAHILLRDLMSERSAELRYGAFRALTTLDKRHPFVRGEKLNNQFTLHVLDTTGQPMVHLTRHKKSEIVVFGANQRLKTPLALRAGRNILVTQSGRSDRLVVSRFVPGERDRRKVISSRVADVIRTVAEFGATYPQVAQLLYQAHRQHNLPGRIEIDALPKAGRVYWRGKQPDRGDPGRKTRIGQSSHTPNLYSANPNDAKQGTAGDEPKDAGDPRGRASLTDITPKADRTAKPRARSRLANWFDPFGVFQRDEKPPAD
ncbi:MAG: flagellar basal body P-ring protein FlgI [Planctomycetaceae bacterium]